MGKKKKSGGGTVAIAIIVALSVVGKFIAENPVPVIISIILSAFLYLFFKRKPKFKKEENIQFNKDQKSQKVIKNSVDTKTFSYELVSFYKLGDVMENHSHPKIEKSLEYEISLIKKSDNSKLLSQNKKINTSDIDDLLLSGKFNSVLGPDGFKLFKKELKGIMNDVNKGKNKDNFINLNDLFEVLLHSGIYCEDTFLPDDMKTAMQDLNWLTAYRFINKNLHGITYDEFRLIVKNLNKTNGSTINFEESEKKSSLYKKICETNVFSAEVNAREILSTLSMSDLRELCKEFQVASKRSKEETIESLLDNDFIVLQIESQNNGKSDPLVFSINDKDLVSGKDIILLDNYLRDVAKHIRNEIFQFTAEKQQFKLVG